MRRALALALAALVLGAPAAEAARTVTPKRCAKATPRVCRAERCAKGATCRVTRRTATVARGRFGALVRVTARRPARPARPVAAARGGAPATAASPATPTPVTGSAPAPHAGATAGASAREDAPATASLPTVPDVVAPPAASPPPTPPTPARLQVTAREWSLTLSRPSLPAGPAVVELVNRGEDGHDLRVVRAGTVAGAWAELAPGATKKQALELQAGPYVLLCSLPGHREAGMEAPLTVGG